MSLLRFALVATLLSACGRTAVEGDAAIAATGQSGSAAIACVTVSDCPEPPSACVVPSCTGSFCWASNVASGLVIPHAPADCHATACDGLGHAEQTIDPTNVPASTASSCVTAACDGAGNLASTPAALGTACASLFGKWCDGAGLCVECLHASDCAKGETCAAATCVSSACTDGAVDGTETDVDCGGGDCLTCDLGKACKLDADCASSACDATSHTCVASGCGDHHRDGNESAVDCGGSCSPCALESTCVVDQDCKSEACDALTLTCGVSSCADHRIDGSETDIDCGGGLCPPCVVSKSCLIGTDCTSGECAPGPLTCASTQCTDDLKNGLETDVDCGGGVCSLCAVAKACQQNFDCASYACDAKSLTCVASQCVDHRQDGNETAPDCGGSCPPCVVSKACLLDQDCASKACDAKSLTCVADQCADHQKDGKETDVDCGGLCPPCALGQGCSLESDCISKHCNLVGGVPICVVDPCTDGIKDGNETGVDCGGGPCAGCPLGETCEVSYDCASKACDAIEQICVSDGCTDHEVDGTETDIDCGGPNACARCPSGKWCSGVSDCTPGLTCSSGFPHICE